MRVRPLPSASTPMLKRSAPQPTAPRRDAKGSAAATRTVFHAPSLRPLRRCSSSRERIRWISGSAAVPHSNAVRDVLDFRPGFRPFSIRIFILLSCCTRFELIVRPRLDCGFNDVSMYPRRSPMPTHAGLPRTPSSGVAVSCPCRSWLRRLTITSNRCSRTMLGHLQTPSDSSSYRAFRPLVPPRLDLALARRSHGEYSFLGGPRSM
jgi:hypothetical protein